MSAGEREARMPEGGPTQRQRARTPRRDAAASKRRILLAALHEFSENGLAGARIDAIAERAQVSKPMIYSYFGDKDELYKAALREAYVQIRQGERKMETDDMSPAEAIHELVRFTLDHFVSKPWFIRMLNTENLVGGDNIRGIADAAEIQSPLIDQIRDILERGARAGVFRDGIDPVEFYITLASLCYFPVSNKHTLRAVFHVAIDDEWLARKTADTAELLLRYLAPGSAKKTRTHGRDDE
ncbi:MAG: TetR family transcriptional regulator [Paracoccaceae bacterium]|jgi:AcrR family transcriptional regulator|nr:TetR family transcriptional regulator [Paracoccaceae bacterium]